MSTIKITTLTPIHVGSGKFLQGNIEFLKSSAGNGTYIGIIDDKKVLSIIGDENVHHWVSIIEKRESLLEYLQKRKPGIKLDEVCNRILRLQSSGKNHQTLKEHIHNGTGVPFIPGSSLKGAIRSAILNSEIRNQNRKYELNDLKNNSGKISAKNIEGKLFGRDPNHDLFRFLRIGDAYFEPQSTVAVNLNSLNIVKYGEDVILDNKTAQLIEVLDKEKSTNLEMRIDKTGLELGNQNREFSAYPVWLKSLNELFTVINNNTATIIDEELYFWEDETNKDVVVHYLEALNEIKNEINNCKNACIIRLGHGIGWTFINGRWAKLDEIISDDIFEKIVDASRPSNWKMYKDYPFPKTRRVIDNVDILGFVKLQLIN